MIVRPGIVFYDLEWSDQRLLQIGAISSNKTFERTILTNIHPSVTAKIFLQTCTGPDGRRQVRDCKTGQILQAVSLEEALKDFLMFLQEIYFSYGQLYLLSHGSEDIPILYSSFSQYNMDQHFLARVTSFVNFQDYLKTHFPCLPPSLAALVRICCPSSSYRLHTALDDARATADVFHEVHRAKKDWSENTALVLTDTDQFGWEYGKVPKVGLNSIVFEKESKHLNNLMKKLNPSQKLALVEHPEELADLLPVTVGLFQTVDPPDCIQFVADGWVTRHHQVSLDGAERTVIGLLCYHGSSYFTVQYYPNSKATFKQRALQPQMANSMVLVKGTPVTARVKLKHGQIRVMFLTPRQPPRQSGALIDALKALNFR